MTDQTLVDRAVASAIENFSTSSYAPWSKGVEPSIGGAIDKAVDDLDVGATVHDVVYSLLDPRVMTRVNAWLASAAVKGGAVAQALNTKIKPKLDKVRIDNASKRAAGLISSSITQVFKDFRESERAKYETVASASELSKRTSARSSTINKDRNVSMMNADYDVATGVLTSINTTGVPFSNILGERVKISSGGSPTANACVLNIETDLNMGILISVSPPTKTGHIQTKTLYLGSNESRTVSFPLKPGTTSGVCEISVIALMEM